MGAACLAVGVGLFARSSLLDHTVNRVTAATVLLAGALFLGAALIAIVARWRKRQENKTVSTHDQLASFRVLYERGEMSAEEFERVRRKLLGQLKVTVAAPETVPTPAELDVPPKTKPPENDVLPSDH